EGTLAPALVERIGAAPGVVDWSTVRRTRIDSERGITEIVAYKLSPHSHSGFRFKEGDPSAIWPAFEDQEAVLISEPYAYRHGLGVNALVRLRTDHGERDFRVAGVYYDYGSDQGVIAMSRRTYERNWTDRGVSGIGIYLDPDTAPKEIEEVLHRIAGPHQEVQIVSNRAIREASLEVFDRTFAITEVLRLLAAVVAFIGVFSALTALELERAREFGMLRAIGLTPRQLWGLIMSQTGLMGVAAGLLALPVGVALAVTLIYVINQRSFGWTMDAYISSGSLAQAMLLAVTAAVLAGIYPAFKMTRARPADMLREE
ncbi:MAG: ABC transporter permease, partial [Gammaproteobacteria bacterium]|nr:ABC transporter permease [Gammaproteobacteria bacterium]